MNKSFFLSILCCFIYITTATSQELTGQQLLEKSIQYHDPNGNWKTFNGTLQVTMETPKNEPRVSTIKINLPKEYFYLKAARDGKTTEYTIEKNDCTIAFNGKTDISEEVIKENKLKISTFFKLLKLALKLVGFNLTAESEMGHSIFPTT